MKYVPYGLIDNMTALVQIMAWRRRGGKPLSEAMLVCFTDAYMIYASLGFNELTLLTACFCMLWPTKTPKLRITGVRRGIHWWSVDSVKKGQQYGRRFHVLRHCDFRYYMYQNISVAPTGCRVSRHCTHFVKLTPSSTPCEEQFVHNQHYYVHELSMMTTVMIIGKVLHNGVD